MTRARRPAFVVVLAAAFAACAPPERRAKDTAVTDTAAVAALDPPTSATAATVAAPSLLGTPPAEVRAVCDSVAARWRAIPRVVVRGIDTVTEAREVDDASDLHLTYAACLVDALRDEGVDSTLRSLRFWPARGWTDIWRLDGDGPGGNAYTYQRGLVRCQVNERSDPGDDGDSTYVPLSYFGETTTCWRHRFPVRVTDTLHVAEP